jgi:hypothetical protein
MKKAFSVQPISKISQNGKKDKTFCDHYLIINYGLLTPANLFNFSPSFLPSSSSLSPLKQVVHYFAQLHQEIFKKKEPVLST